MHDMLGSKFACTMISGLASIEALSDTESENAKARPAPAPAKVSYPKPAGVAQSAKPMNAKQLRRALERPCGCKPKCLQQFLMTSNFQRLLCFRKRLFSMSKLEQDAFARA